MANMATLLKQEITRLARKEVKTGTAVTRRATAQYRRDIAELKRQVTSLAKQVAYLEKKESKRVVQPTADSGRARRFSANGLMSHREKLVFRPRNTPTSSASRARPSTTGSRVSRGRANSNSTGSRRSAASASAPR